MKRRFFIYLFGLGLGLILTWALVIRNRNIHEVLKWTPTERILEELRNDTAIARPANFWCRMNCLGFSSIDYEELLVEGSVDFGRSKTNVEHKIYLITYETPSNGTLEITFVFLPGGHEIVSVNKQNEHVVCDCES